MVCFAANLIWAFGWYRWMWEDDLVINVKDIADSVFASV